MEASICIALTFREVQITFRFYLQTFLFYEQIFWDINGPYSYSTKTMSPAFKYLVQFPLVLISKREIH